MLDYFFDVLLPKSGMIETDRLLLKDKLARHDVYRQNSGEGDISWMAHLQKSAIQAFQVLEAGQQSLHSCDSFKFPMNNNMLLYYITLISMPCSILSIRAGRQALVYDKKFDGSLKQTAKSGGGTPEAVLEFEAVKDEWDKVLATLRNEEAEKKAASELEAGAGESAPEGLDVELEQVRKPPSQHSEGSEKYWQAVANQTVRTYCSFSVEPKTLDGVISLVSGSPLKDFHGETGKNCVMTHLDMDGLGESLGPGQRPFLRKKFVAEATLCKKLLHGAMIARNAQRKGDESDCPADGEIVFIHTGFEKSMKDAEKLFRPETARKDAPIGAEQKEVTVIFSDSSIRSRKQRVRGSYTSKSNACLFSCQAMVPEKPYPDFSGHNMGDIFATIPALQTEDLWHLSRTDAFFSMIY